jgi:hypothetical protein
MDRQGVRRDDVALLREGTQIDRSSLAQEQVDHSTASLADEMIVLAGLGIESGSLFVQEEGADLTPVDETVKVAINGGETDPRQFFVNPLVDLMGERVSVIALESFEHLLQLARRTFAGGPPHRLTSNPGYRADRIEPSVGAGYQIDGFLSSDSPGDSVSSGGVEREELGLSADATKQTVNVIAASAVGLSGPRFASTARMATAGLFLTTPASTTSVVAPRSVSNGVVLRQNILDRAIQPQSRKRSTRGSSRSPWTRHSLGSQRIASASQTVGEMLGLPFSHLWALLMDGPSLSEIFWSRSPVKSEILLEILLAYLLIALAWRVGFHRRSRWTFWVALVLLTLLICA